jgi:hypothetical protein
LLTPGYMSTNIIDILEFASEKFEELQQILWPWLREELPNSLQNNVVCRPSFSSR